MNVALVRMVALAFADPTLGVNAQIDQLALDTSLVTGLADDRPPHVTAILNQADHNVEVREADPGTTYPLIAVCVRDPFAGPGQVWSGVQDDQGDVHAVYVTQSGYDAVGFRATDYTLRAMKRAVHAYLLGAATRDVHGARNSVAIKSAPRMERSFAGGAILGGQVAGLLKITFALRDQTP